MSGPTLFLACDAADFVPATGECLAPYYTLPPSFLPYLSYSDGFAIAGSIGGIWALGVVARIFIRTADVAR